MSQTAKDIARELDRYGITAVSLRDPEEGNPVAAIRLADAAILLGVVRAATAPGQWFDSTPVGATKEKS